MHLADGVVRLHLARTGDSELDASITGFIDLAERSDDPIELVDDLDAADVVLLTQAHLCRDPLSLKALRDTDAWRNHKARTFVVDWRDRPWCAFPGLYSSMPRKHFRPRWQRPWMYPWIDESRFLPIREEKPDQLFSFVGGRTHPVRNAVLNLSDPRAIVEDSSGFDYLDQSSAAAGPRASYAEVMARSKFVLCPRGHGTNSFRVQEVLAAGRVPVIISDEWVPPAGPLWSRAVVTWPESRVADLPAELARIESGHAGMAAAAGEMYDAWFSSRRMLGRMVEQLLLLGSAADFPRSGRRDLLFARLAVARNPARLKRR